MIRREYESPEQCEKCGGTPTTLIEEATRVETDRGRRWNRALVCPRCRHEQMLVQVYRRD